MQPDDRIGPDGPSPATRADPLTADERRLVAVAAVVPVPVSALLLVPVALVTGAGPAQVVAAAVVYGGLLGLAAAFVTVDRLQSRQCPRCHERNGRRAVVCPVCGYDLEQRPRFACDERHAAYLDDAGLCACGRRLKPVPVARGIGAQVVFAVKLGAWLLAFLVGVAVLLRLLERGL